MQNPAFVIVRQMLAAIALATSMAAWPAQPLSHVEAELVGEQTSLAPGHGAWLGLHLKHAPHWHTYWINPGDSGLPTRLSWSLPEGYTAGAIAWPAPQRLPVGELNNFGYVGELLLPVPISVASSAASGSTALFRVVVRWLECEEICVPGTANLELALPVRRTQPAPDARWSGLFAASRAAAPTLVKWSGQAKLGESEVEILVRADGVADTAALDAFALQPRVIENQPAQFTYRQGMLVIHASRSQYFSAAPAQLEMVLTESTGADRRAWQFSVPVLDAVPAIDKPQP